MTSSSRATRPVRRVGTMLLPPALGTLAVLPGVLSGASVPAVAANPGAVANLPLAPVSLSVGVALRSPVVAASRSGNGFVLAAADGGVFAIGGAGYYGSMGGQRLNRPIVGIAATPTGGGYWLVAADGGIFSFGDARFFGSMGGRRLNAPIVGITASPSGRGYWLVGADGGVFNFGDAPFLGSMGGSRLVSPVTGIAAAPGGYYLAAADGGVFTFGVPFLGSAAGRASAPVTAIASGPGGYWLAGSDGSVYAFGAQFQGAPVYANQGDVVGMAAGGGSYRLATTNGTLLGPNDGGPAPAPAPVRAASVSSAAAVAAGVVSGINADRSAHGIGPVASDAQLTSLASDWSSQMAARNTLSHRDLGSVLSSPAYAPYSTLGETIYVGDATSTTADAVMTGWENSPVHQAVVTDGRFNVVGVGVYVSGGRMWVTADFGGR